MTRLVEQRRALPDGPEIVKDYRFKDANGEELGLIDLFGDKDTLVTYFWMYGPQRARPCPMCTNWLGAVNGNAADIEQRVALKILGRSPVQRQLAFAQERGWRGLDFVQTVGDDYANDLGLINEDGSENPALIVFTRDGDKVRLFWASEMTSEMADPGQDPARCARHRVALVDPRSHAGRTRRGLVPEAELLSSPEQGKTPAFPPGFSDINRVHSSSDRPFAPTNQTKQISASKVAELDE